MSASHTPWRQRLLALSTLFGRRRGFFIPYRYAASTAAPASYPALVPLFAANAAHFRLSIETMAAYLPELAACHGPAPAPRFEQDWFPRLDAAAAYALVRERQPARIVEVGSGHSTRFLARAIADGRLSTKLVAIDPAPRASLQGLAADWRQVPLQAASTVTAELSAGDVLFIDSSHILMPGSDVDLLFNDVIPRLPRGVLVHIHDIFLPDAYPASWEWRGYNEQNAVAGLLHGVQWRLLWSSHWAATRMAADIAASGLGRLPLMAGAQESSLWLEKL